MTLFSFLTPGLIINKITPMITGIRAVTALVSDSKYPQAPMEISIITFIKLAMYGFIIYIFFGETNKKTLNMSSS